MDFTGPAEQHVEPDYFKFIASTNAYEEAGKKGLTVVVPAPNQLFLDFDNAVDFGLYKQRLRIFEHNVCPVEGTKETASRSRKPGHYHVVVTLARKVTPVERILFQALLGSDGKRELLSYVRVLNGDPVPTLFFEKP